MQKTWTALQRTGPNRLGLRATTPLAASALQTASDSNNGRPDHLGLRPQSQVTNEEGEVEEKPVPCEPGSFAAAVAAVGIKFIAWPTDATPSQLALFPLPDVATILTETVRRPQ